MRIFLTGGTGLIGRRLIERSDDHRIFVLTRNAGRARASFDESLKRRVEFIEGNAMQAGAWQDALDGCDAVVHLAGAGIADKRWSESYRKLLIESRVESAARIVEGIERAKKRPAVLLSASAIGIYGDTSDRITDESGGHGEGFLVDLCRAWEEAALSAEALGVRVVMPRIGVVLDRRGGALGKLVMPVRMFVGGPIGSGQFYMSWIHHADLIELIRWCLRSGDVVGPLNAVAPEPVRNRDFMRALGRALGRPSWLPAPPIVLRLALGEFATWLTTSQRIVPGRAIEAGFEFRFETVESAMDDLFSGPND